LVEDTLEHEMAEYIRSNFVSLGNNLPMSVLKQTLTMLVHGFVASGYLTPAALNFKCSGNYMRSFLKPPA
jgi:hypothetical protein